LLFGDEMFHRPAGEAFFLRRSNFEHHVAQTSCSAGESFIADDLEAVTTSR
jgi:hypothetical protein